MPSAVKLITSPPITAFHWVSRTPQSPAVLLPDRGFSVSFPDSSFFTGPLTAGGPGALPLGFFSCYTTLSVTISSGFTAVHVIHVHPSRPPSHRDSHLHTDVGADADGAHTPVLHTHLQLFIVSCCTLPRAFSGHRNVHAQAKVPENSCPGSSVLTEMDGGQ